MTKNKVQAYIDLVLVAAAVIAVVIGFFAVAIAVEAAIAEFDSDWMRTCDGRLVIEKTAGVWTVTCKQGGSGIEVIAESKDDPTPWPRDATTEAIFKATWTPEPYPPVPVYP